MKSNIARINELEKRLATQGPRGGDIIGYTKSIDPKTGKPKPIYDSHDHPDHAQFDANDHHDAANAHEEKAAEAKLNQRKRFVELAHHSKQPGDTLKAEKKDPATNKLKQDWLHHHNQSSKHFWSSQGKPAPGSSI